MDIDLTLTSLFKNVFGVTPATFEPSIDAVKGDTAKGVVPLGGSARTEQGAKGAPYYAIAANGREYYLPVTISYTDTNGILQKYNLPYPSISIQSGKRIIDTYLTDQNGSVSELIQLDNYKISVKGFMLGIGNEYPEADVTQLRTVFEQISPLTVGVTSVVTDIFLLQKARNGSNQVTMRNMEILPNPGVKHVRPYEIELHSDAPFNLILSN